jgi:hypothetical protein
MPVNPSVVSTPHPNAQPASNRSPQQFPSPTFGNSDSVPPTSAVAIAAASPLLANNGVSPERAETESAHLRIRFRQ